MNSGTLSVCRGNYIKNDGFFKEIVMQNMLFDSR